MGTSLDNSDSPKNQGIIPRAATALFEELHRKSKASPNYKSQVLITFLELYNEELLDLLNPSNHRHGGNNSRPSSYHAVSVPTIREDPQGGIYWKGVKEIEVHSPEELLDHLYKGLICRTTASTDMNLTSSRSHAIFTLSLKQEVNVEGDNNDHPPEQHAHSIRNLISKFHFVDLAGSERLKKTNAIGGRAKEGISINAGLLALGNVISALGDESRRSSHIPYRNSKLTRLLQDSIGGNSQTLMLACISPAEVNFLETLNTLKYANRARNIKNRVQINQDMANPAEEIARLKSELARLRHQLQSGDSAHPPENKDLVQHLQTRVTELTEELTRVQAERDLLLLDRAGENVDGLPTAEDITNYAQLVTELRSQVEHAEFLLKESRLRDKPKPKKSMTQLPSTKPITGLHPSRRKPGSYFQNNLTGLDIDSKALEAELEELAQSINTMPDFKDMDDVRSESGAFVPRASRRTNLPDLAKASISNSNQTKSVGGTPQPSSPNTEADDSSSRIQFLQSQIDDLTAALAQAKKERDHAINSSIPKQRKAASFSNHEVQADREKGKIEKELLRAKETIQKQQTELNRLKGKPRAPTSVRPPARPKPGRPLSEYPDYNTSHAHASSLRAAYKKKMLDQEIEQFLLGRVTRQALGSLIEHKDKLLDDQAECQAKREQLLQNPTQDPESEELEALDEQIEEIEADLEYTVARIRALELKAETHIMPHNQEVRDDLYGEGNYRAALKILHELESAEISSMFELLLREMVAKRLEQGALTQKLAELSKQREDLELFIKTFKATTATMTLNYEARIAALINGENNPDFDPFAPHPDAENMSDDALNSINTYLNNGDLASDDLDLSFS
ncbi:hypothetical protein DSO57_1017103 [Entomophthora muscae]|uniref:Uncharacterized protein n=1 Tax=Entomophthora muscae TaxID=34485 RepID=A0ACC2TG50_9FUNG|nr:hypothetical protein DSO57_1017103 [Entomophthora muscae]